MLLSFLLLNAKTFRKINIESGKNKQKIALINDIHMFQDLIYQLG